MSLFLSKYNNFFWSLFVWDSKNRKFAWYIGVLFEKYHIHQDSEAPTIKKQPIKFSSHLNLLHDFIRTSWTLFNLFDPPWTLDNLFEHYWTLLKLIEPDLTFVNRFASSGTVSILQCTILNFLGTSWTFSNLFKTFFLNLL